MSLQKIDQDISWVNTRVHDDLRYVNGKWDTSIYNADPLTPHPAGAGGFNTPLYIVTTDGFVIERTQLIGGFLDTASLGEMSQYIHPQTIETISNEKWRVLSMPIDNKSQIIGGILVSQYYPAELPTDLNTIDKKLKDNLKLLSQGITQNNGILNISKLHVQDLNYELSYQVVNQDRVILHKGRVPTYMDPQIIKELIDSPQFFTIKDSITGDEFRMQKSIFYDDQNNPKAIIINGESLKSVKQILNTFLLFSALGFLVHIAAAPFAIYILKKIFASYFTIVEKVKISKISFDSKTSLLMIDESIVPIPHKSKQAHLLKILFEDPVKSRHQEELFGLMEVDNWRTLYDATLMVNKRCGLKLITYANKYFQINDDYIKSCHSLNIN